MSQELKIIAKRFNVDINQESPIRIDGSRYKELPKLFWKLGYRVGAEIGVKNGRYSRFICMWNRKLKLYCVDPWIKYDEYPEEHIQNTGEKIDWDICYHNAKKALAPYNCELIRGYSVDVSQQFKDNSLDFVYIDANHSFRYVIDDIAVWSKKVRAGGIISGHDYYNTREVGIGRFIMAKDKATELCQVKDAVDAWTKAYNIKTWFITNGKEKAQSWFWVKER